jgi:hypothetical protein
MNNPETGSLAFGREGVIVNYNTSPPDGPVGD